MISAKDLFGLNSKQLEIKTVGKRMGPLSFLSPADAQKTKKERDPRHGRLWRERGARVAVVARVSS
jgi:hypothetical protein